MRDPEELAPPSEALGRRAFFARAAAFAVGARGLRAAWLSGALTACSGARSPTGRYGPLRPDPHGVLDLPAGFRYSVWSSTGERMSDGLAVPAAHDGMAAFPGPEGSTVLVRNHELITAPRTAGTVGAVEPVYDPGRGAEAVVGGTTTLVFDTRAQRLVHHRASLVGTVRNCAGGPTPWGTFLSCEETVQQADAVFARDHGYVFEVPAVAALAAEAPELEEPRPLVALGRFRHEAAAVDPDTGVVYLTEDRPEGLLYRFVPDQPGALARGGRLQALAVRAWPSADLRNWNSMVRGIECGRPVSVSWVELSDVEAPLDDLRFRGRRAGAGCFARGEGAWWARDRLYFTCTTGGSAQKGQLWSLHDDVLTLVLEPNDAGVLDCPDNIAAAPDGDLVLCEDGPGRQLVLGVSPRGEVYPIARNALNNSEFAGATFSPDGTTLFVNIQRPGHTLAITGPWSASGPSRG